MPTTTQPSIAAAVILDGQGFLLLIRRTVAEPGLEWQFPAGKVEPGETPEEAAVREAREEAGVTVRALRILHDRIHDATGRHVIYVACVLESGSPHAASPGEVAEVALIPFRDVARFIPHAFAAPVNHYLTAASADEEGDLP
ncbi:NUDIX hydrolase [Streptomyces tsukubensis]|uniref:NUDIX hydrolase n=1 Tax=Streptomyces tsukubensis TaxID=83656 RepID=UPI0036B68E88